MLAGAVAILALVIVLIGLSFRNMSAQRDEVRLERTWIFGLGLGFSLAVLFALLAFGISTGARLTAPATDPVQVTAKATLNGWQFSYEDVPGADTENILHIPAGRDVVVRVTTGDIIHSFWVPRLAGKIDAIPGHENKIKLRADMDGLYQGVSAEYSGPGYLDNRFEVRAHDAASWQAFVSGDLR